MPSADICTLLTIETSTGVCSCALSRGGEVLVNRESYEEQSHASLLGVFVHEITERARREGLRLDAVAVSSGPGSYTGLRIGVSTAKGFSYGLGVPLIAIPTPTILASMMADRVGEGEWLCPMIDARRMEVYATLYDRSLNVLRETAAEIVKEGSYTEWLDQRPVTFFGDGAAKCRSMITHPNARFVDDVHPLASAMVPLAGEAFRAGRFEDVAYFEPFYLKEFVATVPRNKWIHSKA